MKVEILICRLIRFLISELILQGIAETKKTNKQKTPKEKHLHLLLKQL